MQVQILPEALSVGASAAFRALCRKACGFKSHPAHVAFPYSFWYAWIMKNQKQELNIQTKNGTFRTLIWWHKGDKAYLVEVPSLPEVVTFGVSLADAKRMAKDVIELYCSVILDQGKIIIDDTGRVIGRLPKARILAPVMA